MIVQERHKELAGLTVRREDGLFDPLAILKNVRNVRRSRAEPLNHTGQLKEQRVVQCGIDADRVSAGSRVPPNELSDRRFVIVDLAEGEEVLLPGAESELPHCVTENPLKVRRNELEGIDPKPVNVEFGDDVLVTADQNVLGGRRAAPGSQSKSPSASQSRLRVARRCLWRFRAA